MEDEGSPSNREMRAASLAALEADAEIAAESSSSSS
jgi:hypothetical protein